jgi:hypothetical protein
MDNKYSVDVDMTKRLIEIKCIGFWEGFTLHSLLTDLEPKERRLAETQKPYYVLLDLSEFPVQTREIADDVEKNFREWSQSSATTAIVTSGALANMQFARIAGDNPERRQLFRSMDEAVDWLRSKRCPI